jgi:hypothetical protein
MWQQWYNSCRLVLRTKWVAIINERGHNNQRFLNHTLRISKEIFKMIRGMHVMCESKKICSRIGLEKQENWITLLRIHLMSTQNNDSQSISLPPLIRSFLLKCPHSPVMYMTIYPFAIALLNHTDTLPTTACLFSRTFKGT